MKRMISSVSEANFKQDVSPNTIFAECKKEFKCVATSGKGAIERRDTHFGEYFGISR